MATIESLEKGYSDANQEYDELKKRVSNVYELSRLSNQDSTFIQFLNNLSSDTLTFYGEVNGVNCKSEPNYDKTNELLDACAKNISFGITQFSDYAKEVLAKSKEVFDEYKEEYTKHSNYFGTVSSSARNIIDSAKHWYELYQSYDNDISLDNNTSTEENQSSNFVKTSYYNYYELCVRNALKSIDEMEKLIRNMEEVLSKGLEKN